MGRFPNIAAAKAATGAAKGKLYGMYAREIYQVAKSGGATPEGNPSLKRLIEKAKKEQVPADVIKRALDKVNSGVDESFETLNYEVFGPNGSTLIVSCLTDNPNRSISSVKAVLNKCKCKIGVQGSVSFNYDNLCIVGVKGTDEESVMNALIENDCDIEDIENDNGIIMIYGNPKDLFAIKNAITSLLGIKEFEIDEISMLPKEKLTLEGDDLELFKRLYNMLDEVEDVKNIYHNVEL